jgi:heme/copper-type cytochrome/quinol oxidase subunit 2
MKTGRVNSQLPTPNSQRPTQFALGVGGWLIASGSSVLACPQCFGAEESSLIDGAKLGVVVMVAVTLVVQGAFVAFFLYLRKRAKRMADSDLETEWLALQRGSRTS